MAAKHKIIFVSQEITPYLSVTDNAAWGRSLPTSIQQRKYEVRTFMPDYGDINERRNQLHEVIRLSGLNVPISNNDHPLIVKVASMHPSRIQVYFLDNDDYFQLSETDSDSFGTNRADNDERIIFYTRATMETAVKLRWEPEIMQVSGWISAVVPLYMKRLFNGEEQFPHTKVVYTILPETPVDAIDPAFFDKLVADGVAEEDVAAFRSMPLNHKILYKMAIAHADAVVFGTETPDPELVEYAESLGKTWKHFTGEGDHADDYDALYKSLMEA